MAEPRMFTEDEHLAVLSDRVANETAELTAKVAQLEAEKADLQTKFDTAEAARIAAESATEAARQELADFKTETERAAQIAQVREERAAKVRELTSDDFVTEERAERYAEMEQAAFDTFVADLADAKAKHAAQPPAAPEKAAFTGGAPAQPPAPAGGNPTSVAGQLFAAGSAY